MTFKLSGDHCINPFPKSHWINAVAFCVLSLFLSISANTNALIPKHAQIEKSATKPTAKFGKSIDTASKTATIKNTVKSKKPIFLQSNLSVEQKKTINNYRLQILKSPKKLLRIVSVIPSFKDGKMQGIKLKSSKNKTIFSALGFESGDILTKINGITANHFNKFAKMRQLIYNNKTFDLKITRNNHNIRLLIRL